MFILSSRCNCETRILAAFCLALGKHLPSTNFTLTGFLLAARAASTAALTRNAIIQFKYKQFIYKTTEKFTHEENSRWTLARLCSMKCQNITVGSQLAICWHFVILTVKCHAVWNRRCALKRTHLQYHLSEMFV